jgi:hypothetical protein
MEGDRWPLEPEWIYQFPVEEEVFAYDWAKDEGFSVGPPQECKDPRPFDCDDPS